MDNIILDLGNYEIKALVNGQLQVVRSQRFQLPTGASPLKADDHNPLLEYQGKRYHYGEVASKYRSQQATVVDKKENLVLPALLAVTDEELTDCHVKVMHPEPQSLATSIQRELTGMF